jgi:thiol-disulfide isomerase/thioredoxin
LPAAERHPIGSRTASCGINWSQIVRLSLFLAAPLILLASCDGSAPPANETAAAANASEEVQDGLLDRSLAGTPAPATFFEDPEGDRTSLADFKGKPVLVNLWATWCAPCIEEMPRLDALAAREKGKLQVLTISQDRDGRAKVETFFDKHGFANLDSYLDPETALLGDLKIDTLPSTILFDSQGREVWRMVGIADWVGKEAAALIAEAK